MLFVAFVVIVGVALKKKMKRNNNSPLVRAKGHPIFGNVSDFKSDKLLTTFQTFPTLYGSFIELYLLWKRFLLITDIHICREILSKRPKKFNRLNKLDYANKVLNANGSLFNAKGHEWIRIRKATAPSFSNLNVSSKVTTVAKEIFQWIQTLHKDPDLSKKTLDMKYEAFSLTVRVITVVAFGMSTDHPLCQYFVGPFSKDVETIFRFTGESSIYPFPRFFWKYSSKYHWEIDAIAANNRVYDYGRKIVDYKREFAKNGQLQNNCMVDSMILNEQNATDKALTDEEIIVNVRTFYMAGADTTAVTITWAAYYFATQPVILQKVREEVTEKFFQGKTPEAFMASEDNRIDMESLSKLIYTNAVIKEVLRLKSPAHSVAFSPIIEGKDNSSFTLSNGIVIYPDDTVYVNIDGLHRDPKVFLNPFEFNPDRWLIDDSEQLKLMEYAFIPFGAGPRLCPGMGLAFQESTLALAFLAYYFNFTLDCPVEEIVRIPQFVATATKMPIILTHVNSYFE